MKLVLICLLAGAAMTAAGAFADDDALPPVLTSPQPTGAACAALQRQFDQAITARASAPKAATARVRRQRGGQECNSGHYDTGVKDLVKALHFIDVQPVMP